MKTIDSPSKCAAYWCENSGAQYALEDGSDRWHTWCSRHKNMWGQIQDKKVKDLSPEERALLMIHGIRASRPKRHTTREEEMIWDVIQKPISPYLRTVEQRKSVSKEATA